MTITIFISILIVVAMIGLKYWQETKRVSQPYLNEERLEGEITNFLKEHSNHLSHLVYLHDKEVFWSKNKNVMILYRKVGKKAFVLGDPIGKENNLESGFQEFLSFCRHNGLKPAFYQISPQMKDMYEKWGFRFFKLGEEAKVPVEQFEMRGKDWAKLRTRRNKFDRKGYRFHVEYPPYSTRMLAKLSEISRSWLGNRDEKSFSVSSFDEEYVSRFPVATLTNEEGEIIAFATLAEEAKHKKTIHIDLMRYVENSPHGTMDVLFVSIMKWASENGYHYCSLGVAPLANVVETKDAKWSEKIAHLVYEHSKSNYNFKGLKEYKGKFYPIWEPKYLAYKKSFFPITLFQIVKMIQRPPYRPQPAIKKWIGVWIQRASQRSSDVGYITVFLWNDVLFAYF